MAAAPHDGFAQLVHAEWTKLCTVRGWLVGLLVAVVLTIGIGLLGPLGSQIACARADGSGGKCAVQSPPRGPDGREVVDDKAIAYRSLSGDGSITARLTDFGGRYAPDGDLQAGMVDGLQPWSKAGILIKDGTTPGSAYAAVLATGAHGVRMQYDYVHDLAGLPGLPSAAAPRWLRLTRVGDQLTGSDSADGRTWTVIGTAHLANLPPEVVVGVFAASPQHEVIKSSFGGTTSDSGPTTATGTFDRIAVTGQSPGDWTTPATGPAAGSGPGAAGRSQSQGGLGPKQSASAVRNSADSFPVTGSGDIAPWAVAEGSGKTPASALAGTFAGLIAVIVVAALTMTAEYRRGLIRSSLAASPRRGRLLAAKATVLGGASFVTGLVAAAVAVPAVAALEHHKNLYVFHASAQTQLRIIVGTAALLAVAAVLALAVGTIVRRGAAAVAAVIVVIVLPYILAVASVLPAGAAQWLTRLTPAAAFAIQQTVTAWPQVTAVYTPTNGYFPLSPWAGLAVLCLYAAAAYGLAHWLLLRRDA
ncbi:MAG: ABC transporter permease subunit [Catenulispora sp.]